jgi:hypothetical protein
VSTHKVELITAEGIEGPIVLISPFSYLILNAPPRPPVTLELTEVCPSCGAKLVSWHLPTTPPATAIACGCTTAAVLKPAEEAAKDWKAFVQIRSQVERAARPECN